MLIRSARLEDAEAIRAIYNHEVAHGTATFDIEERTLAAQRSWLTERSGAHVVLVAEIDDEIVGFAALSRYKERAAYNGTVEDSIYVDPTRQGQGVGLALLEALVVRAREHGFHTLIARIGHESVGSIAVHARAGFVEIGREREVGRKFGRWLDVVIMQRMLS